MQPNTNYSAPSDQEVYTVSFSWLVSDSLRQKRWQLSCHLFLVLTYT